MIFADKLMYLRKKAGYSQEELAEKMGVTRQSVSKWESGQSIPDIEKIIRISDLFEVSIDYLLRDNVEEMPDKQNKPDKSDKPDKRPDGPASYGSKAYGREAAASDAAGTSGTAGTWEPAGEPFNKTDEEPADEQEPSRKVGLDEAEKFIRAKGLQSMLISVGVLMYIISPVSVIFLSKFSERMEAGVEAGNMVMAGIIIMFIIIAAATALVVYGAFRTSPYEYFENEIFETDSETGEMVKDKKEGYRKIYIRSLVTGISLCILAAIPLFAANIMGDGPLKSIMAAAVLIIVGIGVFLIVKGSIMWGSFDRLLQEGDYSIKEKIENHKNSIISDIYWPLATAVYLIYSFTSGNWGRSWIIWVAASVVYPAIRSSASYMRKNKK